jgi:hypothetical protein
MTISRWIVILTAALIAGGVAWLLKLVAIAVLVVTGSPNIESGLVAFFYLTGFALLVIGSTALGLWLTRNRPVPLRIAAVALSPIVFWFSFELLDSIADSIVGKQAPDYVQSETAVLLAALGWLAIGLMVRKSSRSTLTARVT